MSSGMIRLSGLAAMLGGVLGIVLTPILTYLWATYSDRVPVLWQSVFPVYLGCIAGLAGLYALRRRNLGFQGTETGHGEVGFRHDLRRAGGVACR